MLNHNMTPDTGISDTLSTSLPQDTICAVSTPPGVGGIAVIRVSGPKAVDIVDTLFRPNGQGAPLSQRRTHTLAYGEIYSHAYDGLHYRQDSRHPRAYREVDGSQYDPEPLKEYRPAEDHLPGPHE